MKRFWKLSIVFALPLIVVAISLEFYLKHSEGAYLLKSEKFKKADYDVLILGSSHNQNAINPRYLDLEGCNAAMGSQDLRMDLELLKKSLELNHNIKVVILEFSYHRQRQNPKNYWRNSLYEYFYEIKLSEGFNISRYFLLASNIRFFRNYFGEQVAGRQHKYKYNRFGFDENDFDGVFKSLAYNEGKINQQSKRRLKANVSTIPDKEVVERAEEYLTEINSICAKNNIKLVMVAPPVFKTYSSEFNDTRLSWRESIIDKLAEANANITWLNFETSPLFKVSHFKNDDHLNAEGAQIFTTLLNDTLKLNQQ